MDTVPVTEHPSVLWHIAVSAAEVLETIMQLANISLGLLFRVTERN